MATNDFIKNFTDDLPRGVSTRFLDKQCLICGTGFSSPCLA